MDKMKIQDAINTRYACAEFSEDKIRYALQKMKGEELVKKKVSIAFVLAMLLIAAAVTAIAATLWPSFIKDKFITDEPTLHVGMLALVEQMKGVDLTGETEIDDVKVRIHYTVVDGVECIVLFSMQNAKPDMPSVEERLFIAEVDFRTDNDIAAGGRCNVTRWYDEADETLYCLASTVLMGGELPSPGDAQMILSVITQIPMESLDHVFDNGEPIWEIIASVPIGSQIPRITILVGKSVTFDQTTLTITEVDLRTTGATVRFEGKIALTNGGKPRSLMRLFVFEWIGDEEVLPLSLSGTTSVEEDGVVHGEFTFLGILDDMPETLLLNAWIWESPDAVQSVSIRSE